MLNFKFKEHNMSSEQTTSQIEIVTQQPHPKRFKIKKKKNLKL